MPQLSLRGTPLWAKTIGGGGDDQAHGGALAATDHTSHVLLTGTLGGMSGSIDGEQTLLVPKGYKRTPFVAKVQDCSC